MIAERPAFSTLRASLSGFVVDSFYPEKNRDDTDAQGLSPLGVFLLEVSDG